MYPPNFKIRRLVDAAVEPLTLDQARSYLRLDNTTDDSLISDAITAARMECERINDRSFITTSWQLTFDYLPWAGGPFVGLPWPPGQYCGGGSFNRVNRNDGGIFLPYPDLIEVTSLDYVDQGGVVRTIDPANYLVSPGAPGKVYPAYGQLFPLSQPRPAAVNIAYTAGYGPDPADVPKTVLMAMRLLVAHYHKHRTTDAGVPQAVENLLLATYWGGHG